MGKYFDIHVLNSSYLVALQDIIEEIVWCFSFELSSLNLAVLVFSFWLFFYFSYVLSWIFCNRARTTHWEWGHYDAPLLNHTGLMEIEVQVAVLNYSWHCKSSGRPKGGWKYSCFWMSFSPALVHSNCISFQTIMYRQVDGLLNIYSDVGFVYSVVSYLFALHLNNAQTNCCYLFPKSSTKSLASFSGGFYELIFNAYSWITNIWITHSLVV